MAKSKLKLKEYKKKPAAGAAKKKHDDWLKDAKAVDAHNAKILKAESDRKKSKDAVDKFLLKKKK